MSDAIDNTIFPNGFSRADGLDGNVGTPDEPGQVRHFQGGQEVDLDEVTLQEYSDSPEIERAEKATITHRTHTSENDATTRLLTMGRGTRMTDQWGNQSVVLSAKYTQKPGKMADLTVVSEGRFFDPPPDEFALDAVELGVNILKHPRYLYALQGADDDEYLLNQQVIKLLQAYMENPSVGTRDSISFQLWASLTFPGEVQNGVPISDGETDATDWNGDDVTVQTTTGTDLAKRAALEIIQKFWYGIDTPYIVGLEMTWSSFYFIPPYLNLGGYVEDPILDAYPQVPLEYVSVTEPPTANNLIFDAIPLLNPQCYASNGIQGGPLQISWLRKADRIEKQGYIYKVTRRWWGAPVGYWDPDLYTNFDRPSVPDDYTLVTPGRNPPIPAKAS